MPAIIRSLGYNPVPEATGKSEPLAHRRTSLGRSQKEAATPLTLDPSTMPEHGPSWPFLASSGPAFDAGTMLL